jgi:hypothetical protein
MFLLNDVKDMTSEQREKLFEIQSNYMHKVMWLYTLLTVVSVVCGIAIMIFLEVNK